MNVCAIMRLQASCNLRLSGVYSSLPVGVESISDCSDNTDGALTCSAGLPAGCCVDLPVHAALCTIRKNALVSESEIRSTKIAVILSERGPRRTLQPFRGPHEQVFVRGVEVGGGESKACPERSRMGICGCLSMNF